MPLIASTLINEIRTFSDPYFENFLGFPEDMIDTARQWAAAIKEYMLSITTPIALPGVADLAETAMFNAMSAITSGFTALAAIPPPPPPAVSPATLIGANSLGAGLAAFAAVYALPASIATGTGIVVAPTTPFVPPASPPTDNGLVSATNLANAIDIWFKTGTFTPATPPGSPPILWA